MAKRVRAARHYQRLDAPIRLLADHARAGVRRDLLGSLKHLGSLVDGDRAAGLIRSGARSHVKDAVDWKHFREVLKAPFGRLGKLRHDAAALGVRKINGAFAAKQRAVRFRKIEAKPTIVFGQPQMSLRAMIDAIEAIEKDVGDRFNFDLYDASTLDRLRQAQDDLIVELEATARDAIDAIVSAGAQTGLSAGEIVADVREMIGLTDRQALAVMNYRSMLENLDRDALGRQLRNTASDAEVQAAIDGGIDLSDVRIDQLVSDYEENYLDYRAQTIAQTETVRAASEGLSDAYRQAVDRGALPEDAITRNWQVALDEKTCEICLSIPDMNEDGVGLNEDFESADGPIDNPPVHPSCRCSVEYVTDLDKVPDESEEEAA